MNNYEKYNEYIIDKQKLINEILKYKNENNICKVMPEQLAINLKMSVSSIKNKINKINEQELVIQWISRDEFIVQKSEFKNTRQIKNMEKIIKFYEDDIKNIERNQVEVAKELDVERKEIMRVRALVKFDGVRKRPKTARLIKP